MENEWTKPWLIDGNQPTMDEPSIFVFVFNSGNANWWWASGNTRSSPTTSGFSWKECTCSISSFSRPFLTRVPSPCTWSLVGVSTHLFFGRAGNSKFSDKYKQIIATWLWICFLFFPRAGNSKLIHYSKLLTLKRLKCVQIPPFDIRPVSELSSLTWQVVPWWL